jgi:replicative DNA helicase
MTPSFVSGADLLGAWWTDVTTGPPPIRYMLPEPFSSIDVRPGRLILFGGAPGTGKSAALTQITVELLRTNPDLRVLTVNVEMTPNAIIERAIARLSGVSLTAIADRLLDARQQQRIRDAVDLLSPLAARWCFLQQPYTLEHIAAAADQVSASVLTIDYVQQLQHKSSAGQRDTREALEAMTEILRRFCDRGALVLAAAAVARTKDAHGSSYQRLTLASFRGSSSLEYNADQAFLLTCPHAGTVEFNCVKHRYGLPTNIMTTFDARTQSFTPAPSGLTGFDDVEPATQ